MIAIKSIEEIHKLWPKGVSKDRLAKFYGLTNYDTAIPQALFDQLSQNDFDPWSHYVYDYSRWSFGVLFPLTKEGMNQMEICFSQPFNDPRKGDE